MLLLVFHSSFSYQNKIITVIFKLSNNSELFVSRKKYTHFDNTIFKILKHIEHIKKYSVLLIPIT